MTSLWFGPRPAPAIAVTGPIAVTVAVAVTIPRRIPRRVSSVRMMKPPNKAEEIRTPACYEADAGVRMGQMPHLWHGAERAASTRLPLPFIELVPAAGRAERRGVGDVATDSAGVGAMGPGAVGVPRPDEHLTAEQLVAVGATLGSRFNPALARRSQRHSSTVETGITSVKPLRWRRPWVKASSRRWRRQV